MKKLSLAGEIWVNLFPDSKQEEASEAWNTLKEYCQINMYPATHLIADIIEGKFKFTFFTHNEAELLQLASYLASGVGDIFLEAELPQKSLESAERKSNTIILQHVMQRNNLDFP
jgi:hypothetical protein